MFFALLLLMVFGASSSEKIHWKKLETNKGILSMFLQSDQGPCEIMQYENGSIIKIKLTDPVSPSFKNVTLKITSRSSNLGRYKKVELFNMPMKIFLEEENNNQLYQDQILINSRNIQANISYIAEQKLTITSQEGSFQFDFGEFKKRKEKQKKQESYLINQHDQLLSEIATFSQFSFYFLITWIVIFNEKCYCKSQIISFPITQSTLLLIYFIEVIDKLKDKFNITYVFHSNLGIFNLILLSLLFVIFFPLFIFTLVSLLCLLIKKSQWYFECTSPKTHLIFCISNLIPFTYIFLKELLPIFYLSIILKIYFTCFRIKFSCQSSNPGYEIDTIGTFFGPLGLIWFLNYFFRSNPIFNPQIQLIIEAALLQLGTLLIYYIKDICYGWLRSKLQTAYDCVRNIIFQITPFFKKIKPGKNFSQELEQNHHQMQNVEMKQETN